MAAFIETGAAKLYHNGVQKLETTATGVNVTGEVDIDVLKMPDNTAGKILVGNSTSYETVPLAGDATLSIGGGNATITIANDAVNAAKIVAGAVGASEIADGSITSTEFSSPVTLQIKNSSGTVLKTLRSPGS